jgi:hypothetical protein
MITSIHVYIGAVHNHIQESTWEKMGAEMSEKYDCDMVLCFVDQLNTKLSVDGDLTPDEMVNVQYDFQGYLYG